MKAALIGLGMVADTHLAALQASSKVRLHGVLGHRPESTNAYAEKAAAKTGHDVLAYSDLEAIARDTEIDFVILATPPDSRRSFVTALADAGKPVLLEKPIERKFDAALDLVRICEDRQVSLGVVLQHRVRATSQRLKDYVTAGALGDIVALEIAVPWWRHQSYYDAPGRGSYARDGGGVLITQAIHSIDLALWLAGPMATVQALLQRTALHDLEAEDWAGAVFTTAHGAVGSLTATTAAYPGHAETIRLYGTKGSAVLTAGQLQLSCVGADTVSLGENTSSGAGANPMAFTHDWHQGILEDFAAALADRTAPVATGRSALAAHAAIAAMEQSSAKGARVSVPMV